MSVTKQIVSDRKGSRFGITGPDWGQCTALPHDLQKRMGVGIVYGDAGDTFRNAPFPKYTSGQPIEGDVLVFKKGPLNGYAGHTSLMRFGRTSFDQNYPTGSACKDVDHSWDWGELIGWFRIPGVYSEVTQPGTDDMALADANDKNKIQAIKWYIIAITEQAHSDADIRKYHMWNQAEFNADERKALADKFYSSGQDGDEYRIAALQAYKDIYGEPKTVAQETDWKRDIRAHQANRVSVPNLRVLLMKNEPK